MKHTESEIWKIGDPVRGTAEEAVLEEHDALRRLHILSMRNSVHRKDEAVLRRHGD